MSLICTEVFLWLTHQKLDHSKNFWCNVQNWGVIAPFAPPGYAPAESRSSVVLPYYRGLPGKIHHKMNRF